MNLKKKNYKILKNKEGAIYKLYTIRNKKIKSAEVYISEVKANIEKGWNFHKKYISKLYLIEGVAQIKICKNLKNSKIIKFNLKLNKNNFLEIPPKTWFAFKSLNKSKNVKLLNYLSGVHSKREIIKKDIRVYKHPLDPAKKK